MSINKVIFSDNLNLSESFELKVKDKTKNSKKNPVLKYFQGHQICVTTGEWIKKERTIDSVQDKYYEHIETLDGVKIHHCDEKLSDHKGHGSAKFKKT